MRKLLMSLSIIFVLLLSACGGEDEIINNFKSRKDDFYISDDNLVIINYKTDEEGKLIELDIDRLLSIEDMIYFNNSVDYDFVLEGFEGEIFENAGFLCTSYYDFKVPSNIEVGNTKYKYNRSDCEYQEVDRDNVYKTGSYARKYSLLDTIPVSKTVSIKIVVYNETQVDKFVEIVDLPHTVESLGVYAIPINSDLDGFGGDGVYNYYKDMGVYEQLYLKNQINELAITEISGIPTDINLFDLNSVSDITPLIDNFEVTYEEEIAAMIELESEIGINIDDSVGEDNEEAS